MKLLGKLYLHPNGRLLIHSKEDGIVYLITNEGEWLKTLYTRPKSNWRLIGDSYAKD